MNILMLTASLPYPPHQGGALRSFGILHGLHQAGHKITLLSFQDEPGNLSIESTPLAEYCEIIETVPTPNRSKIDRLRDLFLSSKPDIALRLYNDEFYACLKHLIAAHEFDVIQFEGIEIAPYLPLLRRDGVHAKLCYDAFNAEAALQEVIFNVDRGDVRRWPAAAYSFIQSRRIEYFERELCQKADCVIAVSAEDAAILRQYRPDGYVPVVTNGIFVEDYKNPSDQLDLDEYALVFTGKMDYRPNVDAMVWFTEDVLPLIQQKIPQTRLYIVGQKPHSRLDKLRNKHNVEITGWVQEVQPFLRGAGIYIAPLRMGSGTRLKILEAMAAGCTVVATSIAVSGMRSDAKEAMLVCDDTNIMAQEIIDLLNHPSRREALGQKAEAFVKRYYDWSVLIPELLRIYREFGLE